VTAFLVVGTAACGDDGGGEADTAADTVTNEDTATDTAEPRDTSAVDTSSPADTSGGEDTTAEDTAVAGDTVEQDTTVTDTADQDTTTADTTMADTSTGDTSVVDTVVPPTCEAMTLSGELDPVAGSTLYELAGDFGLGSPALSDVLSLEFYGGGTGVFDLGAGSATDYATCEQCVVIYADYDETTGQAAATYFQSGGSLALAVAPGAEGFSAAFSDLTVTEVTIDPVSYTSTPVAGGACYTAAGAVALNVDASAFVCSAVTLPEELDALETDPVSYGAVGDFGLGGEASDLVLVELRTDATGTFDLGAGANADYQTCKQCLTVYEDFDGTNAAAIFFPSAGTLTVSELTPPGGQNLQVSVAGLSLDQVVLSESATHPAPNGACLDVADVTMTAGVIIDPSCVSFSVSGDLGQTEDGDYAVTGDFGVGGPAEDTLSFEFYAAGTGSFDLGEDANANYQNCAQCALLLADTGAGGVPSAVYFARGGVIGVDPATPPGGAAMSLTLTDASFEEVTIDPSTFVSTPVEDGGCYALPGDTPLATPPCVASCGGRVCGADGCGELCGTCPATQTCQLDGSVCQSAPTCFQLTVGGPDLQLLGSGRFGVDITSAGAGAADLADLLQIEFYANGTGTFDLGAGDNANYATCSQCVRAFVDADGEGERQFFQSAGTLVVAPTSNVGAGPAQLGFTGLRLVEVTIQSGTYVSTPVEGGACVDITVSPDLTTD